MAEEERAILRLPEDTKRRLVDLEGTIKRTEEALATMKKLGMDVSVLEERLEWAKTVRETLLKEFG